MAAGCPRGNAHNVLHKNVLGRVPILGSLLVGVFTLFEDEDGDGKPDMKFDKALFKMGGSTWWCYRFIHSNPSCWDDDWYFSWWSTLVIYSIHYLEVVVSRLLVRS